MLVGLLRSKIDSLQKKYNELIDEIDKNNDIINDYIKLEYKCEYDNENFIEKHEKINDGISIIMGEMDDLFKDKNSGIKGKKNCQFDGHCETCIEHFDNLDYCFSNCTACKYYRKMDDKNREETFKNYYNEYINNKPKKIQEYKSQTKIININNNLIINNITIKNYIQTKDLFFHVVITTNEENAEEKLRYMFTYLMCGSSGIKLFPEERKFSKATTYTVTAAKYNINKNSDYTPRYTLHGILRYKYNNTSSMNIKKLENMGNNKFFVKVYVPDRGSNNKSHILKDDIDIFLKSVIDSNNGSAIENFYMEDLNT